MRFLISTIIFAIFNAIYNPLAAQTGSLIGLVTDAKTNETIIGANVVIAGTITGSSTNLDGFYEINNLAPGNYNVVISFISYRTDTITNVNIKGGEATKLNFRLEEQTQSLQGITIVERRTTGTEMSMISAIKTSNVTVSGISRQQISKSQDKNASEVLKRVSGITIIDDRFVVVRGLIERYNTVLLNNSVAPSVETDQRAFSFDIIPSSMIDRILVYKTPAPELPADFAGAAIEVYTKNYPESNTFNVGASVRYKEGTTFQNFYKYAGGKLDLLGFDDGTRAVPDNVPGIVDYRETQAMVGNGDLSPEERILAKQRQTDWGRSFSKTSVADKISAAPDAKLNLEYSGRFTSKNKKITLGNISALHYEVSNDFDKIFRSSYEMYDTIVDRSVPIYTYNDNQYSNKVHLGALQNLSLSFGKNNIEFRNVFNQFGKTCTTYRTGVDYYRNDIKIQWDELAYESRTIYSGQLGGKHTLGKLDISKLIWTLGYAYANKVQPDVRRIYRYAPYINDSTYAPYQLDYTSSANTESNGRLFFTLDENILTAAANFVTKLFIGNFQPDVKAGFYAEKKRRDFGIRAFGIQRAGTTSQFDQSILFQPIDSIYADTNFRFVDTYDTVAPGVYPTAGIKLQDDTRPEYNYNASNNLLAGYAGINFPVTSKLSVYAGVRLEKMRQELVWMTEFAADSVPEKKANTVRDTLNVFPSINVTYNFNDKNLLRLAWGRSINRTEFRETAPYGFYDFELSAIVYGNDSLKNCYIDNFDMRYEWYPTPSEMVTFGGFYKKFNTPIEMNLFPSSNGWDFMYANAVKAYSLGAEVDIRKSFRGFSGKNGFLRSFKDLTLLLNVALIKSEVTSDDNYLRDKHRPMYGQSPYILNVGLYYQNDKSKFAASILYNVIGERIIIVGTPTIPNIYEQPRNLLDFTFSKGIGERIEIKGGIKDILDQPIKYNQTVIFKQPDGSEAKREQIIRKYKMGTSFMVGFSYRL